MPCIRPCFLLILYGLMTLSLNVTVMLSEIVTDLVLKLKMEKMTSFYEGSDLYRENGKKLSFSEESDL